MSMTQSGPLANAKDPKRPWQYLMIFALVLCAIGLGWWLLGGSGMFRQHTAAAPQRTEANVALPYQGPPDLKEAAFRPTGGPPPSAQPHAPPALDEFAAYASRSVWSPQMAQSPIAHQDGLPPQDNTQQGQGGGGGESMLHGATVASVIHHPYFTVPEGKVISCNQITKIDTSAGGNIIVTAVLDEDVWGIGNKMILMNKGTQLIGEVGHSMVEGLDRLAVVWRRGRTPNPWNVRFTLDSPAAGPLGEGGLDGDVDRHYWDKIKGVLLFTLLDIGGSIAQSALAAQGTSTFNLGTSNFNSSAQSIGTILLEHTLNIPDTIIRNQGKKCSVILAGDVDFSKVYGARIVQ